MVGLVVALAALVGWVAVAGDAVAAKKLKAESSTAEIGGMVFGSATATCERERKAVSGGFESEFDPSLPESPAIFPFTSVREGKRRWHAAGLNASSTSGAFTVHAYCRKQRKLMVVSAEVAAPPIPPSGVPTKVTATAKCPKGTKALSGGYDNPDARVTATDTILVVPHVSRKVGARKWRVKGGNLGDTQGTLTVQVNCHAGRKLKVRKRSITVDDTTGTPVVDQVKARCPKRKRLVSGGFASDEGVLGGATGAGPLFIASKRVGRRAWRVGVEANSGRRPEIRSYAYCEKKRKRQPNA